MFGATLDASRIKVRTEELLQSAQITIYKNTDRLFVKLMVFQWLFGIMIAFIISPQAWEGSVSHTHIHVWAAIFLGATIFILPVLFGIFKSGKAYTRYSIAVAQMLYSGLLIHLTGGRIETHFHIFGSLAFLAFYRDWRVLVIAAAVTALDHWFRGTYWPQSIFGILTASPWRWMEHAGWVVFEVAVLIRMCFQSRSEMYKIAHDMAELESKNQQINKAIDELQNTQAQLVQSERKAAIGEIAKAHEAELEGANKKLKAMYELQKEFTSTVSHELRTPLASIKMGIDLVENKMLGEINEQQQEALGHVKSNVDRLKRLIDDILDLTKIESGKLRMHFMMHDIHQVIQEVVDAQAELVANRGLYIKTDFDPAVAQVAFDRDRMIQVLNNLINNAVKFTQQGGITIKTQDRTLENQVLVAVKDTGKGISEDNIAKLFQKFHQIESAQENTEGGTGLGLVICKEIISKHDGKIWVESKMGEGTSFNFTIPIKDWGAAL